MNQKLTQTILSVVLLVALCFIGGILFSTQTHLIYEVKLAIAIVSLVFVTVGIILWICQKYFEGEPTSSHVRELGETLSAEIHAHSNGYTRSNGIVHSGRYRNFWRDLARAVFLGKPPQVNHSRSRSNSAASPVRSRMGSIATQGRARGDSLPYSTRLGVTTLITPQVSQGCEYAVGTRIIIQTIPSRTSTCTSVSLPSLDLPPEYGTLRDGSGFSTPLQDSGQQSISTPITITFDTLGIPSYSRRSRSSSPGITDPSPSPSTFEPSPEYEHPPSYEEVCGTR